MVRLCAWCRCLIGRKPPLDDASVTHGICLACQREMMAAPGVRPKLTAAAPADEGSPRIAPDAARG